MFFFRDGPTDKAIFGRRMRDEEFEKPFDFFEIVPRSFKIVL